MARQRSDADNLRAGFFLLIALIAAVTVVLILAGVGDKLKRRTAYTVFFPLGSDPTGLEINSQVIVNGRPVGVVAGINLDLDPSDADADGTYYKILVDRKIKFYGEPMAYLNRPLLGAGGTLNFPTIGAVGKVPADPPGTQFKGAIAPPSFLAQAGYGPKQQAQMQDILARGSAFADELESMVKDFRENTYPQITEMITGARTHLDGWLVSGDRIVANVDQATAKFPQITDSVDSGVQEARGLIASAQGTIDDNRENIQATVQNAKDASARFDDLIASLQTDTKPTLDAMLTDARDAMDKVSHAVQNVDGLLAESSPSLRRTVTNARLASDQLKLTLEEVRRSPWRLLYRPDTRELEFELLYDAARIYAQAVGNLRETSQSLEIAANAPAGSLNAARAEELNAELTSAFEAYQAAERAFLDLIIEKNPAGSGR